MKILKSLVFLFITMPLISMAQENNKINLEKYWRYRERLKREFMIVSPDNTPGTNIPAIRYYVDGNGTKTYLDWDDANANMSHYLSMLATEYRLLKNNGHNYQETLKELFYAVNAVERLDRTAESYFRGGTQLPADANGWMIRDDVNQNFWDAHHNTLGVNGSDAYYSRFKFENIQSVSQDNIYHLLEGMALIAVLVDTEYVDAAAQTIDFRSWVQDITRRVVRMMQQETFIYFIHTEGNNYQCMVSKPTWWQWVLQPDWALLQQTVYEAFCNIKSKWYIKNPVTNEFATEGAGNEFDTWLFYCYGAADAGNKIIGSSSELSFAPSSGEMQRDVFMSIVDGSYKDEAGMLSTVFSNLIGQGVVSFIASQAGIPPATIPQPVINDIVRRFVTDIDVDPYKAQTLATVGRLGGLNTFWDVRAGKERYGHFPLMYCVLHETPLSYLLNGYIDDRAYYESLLSAAPCLGPRSYRLHSSDDYAFEWATPSRLVWPEHRGAQSGQNIEYNGLDYMVLHNLYSIVYDSDFRKLTVTLSDPISSKDYEEIAVDILANNSVSGTGHVEYTANHSVRLLPGFNVNSLTGATFAASISTAPVDYAGFSQLNACSNIPQGRVGHIAESVLQETDETETIREPVQNIAPAALSISVYPNPTNGIFVIRIMSDHSEDTESRYAITSLTGVTLHGGEFSGSGVAENVPYLAKGVYIITVTSGDQVRQQKLVVN